MKIGPVLQISCKSGTNPVKTNIPGTGDIKNPLQGKARLKTFSNFEV